MNCESTIGSIAAFGVAGHQEGSMNRRRDVIVLSLGIVLGAAGPTAGAFMGGVNGFTCGLMAVLLFAFGLTPWLMFKEGGTK